MSDLVQTSTTNPAEGEGNRMTDTDMRPFAGAARAADYIEETTIQRPRPAPVIEVLPEPALVAVEESVAPSTAAELFDSTGTSEVAKSGLRGLLAKTGIKVPASRAELERNAAAERLRQDETTIRQATFPRAVGVLVANRKGGAGKTPTSIILGGILASIRGGSVAVLEVSDDPGTLNLRSEGTPFRGLEALIGDVETIRTAGQLSSYTAPQTSFASVIGTVHRRRQLMGVDVARLSAVVDDHYAIRVMDSGNQPSSSAFSGAIATADVLVIPVLNSADTVLEALDLLDELRAWGGKAQFLAERAVIIRLIDGRLEQPQLSGRLTGLLEAQHVAAIYEIPYDQHIAERGPITVGALATSTKTAFTAAAAGIIRTLQNQPLSH
jgi:MinD-like ATPase involved in chromosome partitioning or flagellar assembly